MPALKKRALLGLLLLSSTAFCESLKGQATKAPEPSTKRLTAKAKKIALIEYQLGLDYNRQAEGEKALYHLSRAKRLGFTGKNFYLERGIAKLYLLQVEEAIADFNTYNQHTPNQAKTYELLGRAYAILWDKEKARANFDQAKQLATEPFQSEIVRLDQNLQAANFLSVLSDNRSPWQFTAAVGGGYNSNVIAQGTNYPLPTDISRQSSPFANVLLYGHYQLAKSNKDELQIYYQLQSVFYSELSQLDDNNPMLGVLFTHHVNSDTTLKLSVNDNETWVDDNRYSSLFTITPAISYHLTKQNEVELIYAYINQNYFFPSVPIMNRNGFMQLFSFNDYLTLANAHAKLRFGYARSFANTHGADFSYQADTLYAGVEKILSPKLSFEALYLYNHYQYLHLNSLREEGRSKQRRDNTNNYSLQLIRKLTKTTSLYAHYQNYNDNSNLSFYRYKQYIVSMGLTANWS